MFKTHCHIFQHICLYCSYLTLIAKTKAVIFNFLACIRRLTHVIAIGWMSVCLSIRLSHACTVSKRLNLSQNCLHCLVAP